jgi:hypothetical protein
LSIVALLPAVLLLGSASPTHPVCVSVAAQFGGQGSSLPPALDLVITLGAIWWPQPRPRRRRARARRADKFRPAEPF